MSMMLTDETAVRLKEQNKKHLTIGIRPENMSLVGADEAVLSADCLVVEPQGSHQIVAIEMDNKIMKIVVPPRPQIQAGETIHLAFKQESILFFDKETKLRI
jgi:multiple sugar transport system ATP-binding protein